MLLCPSPVPERWNLEVVCLRFVRWESGTLKTLSQWNLQSLEEVSSLGRPVESQWYLFCCLLSCDWSTFKRVLFVSDNTQTISVLQQDKESTLGTALTLCINNSVLLEPLAHSGFSPIQRMWKRHRGFVHAESKKPHPPLGFSPELFYCITFFYCKTLIPGLCAVWNSVCLICQSLYLSFWLFVYLFYTHNFVALAQT